MLYDIFFFIPKAWFQITIIKLTTVSFTGKSRTINRINNRLANGTIGIFLVSGHCALGLPMCIEVCDHFYCHSSQIHSTSYSFHV